MRRVSHFSYFDGGGPQDTHSNSSASSGSGGLVSGSSGDDRMIIEVNDDSNHAKPSAMVSTV